MRSIVRITLEGLPERVHAIADALDEAVPGAFEWHDAVALEQIEILLYGVATLERGTGTNQPFRLVG